MAQQEAILIKAKTYLGLSCVIGNQNHKAWMNVWFK